MTVAAELPFATLNVLTNVPAPLRIRAVSEPFSLFEPVRLTVSREPSPFGENHWLVVASGVSPDSCGATVSTTTVRLAAAGAVLPRVLAGDLDGVRAVGDRAAADQAVPVGLRAWRPCRSIRRGARVAALRTRTRQATDSVKRA